MKLFSTSVVSALTQGEVVEEVPLLQNKVFTDDDFDAALSRATSDLPKATDATGAEVDDMVGTFSQDLMKTDSFDASLCYSERSTSSQNLSKR